MKTINKTCKICGNIFTANANRAAFCSLECKKTAKKLNDKKYRESEHGAAVRRKNRKNASVIESRKRYEKTDAYKNSSKEDDAVLDPFGGSGTTIIACEKLNRTAYVNEIDPHYCDVIRKRWTKWAEENGVDAGSGALR